jgi:hypothetical protein
MGLFSYSDINKPITGPKGKLMKTDGSKNKHTTAKEASELINAIHNMEQDTHYHFCTAGSWSLHDMIALVCEKIGSSRLYLTTWTITEEPMRVLFKLINDGYISELNCLFDYRIEKRKAEAFQLAKVTSSNIKLTKIHAKAAVLINDEWAVSIVGSANLTKNPRIEAGMISTNRGVAEFHAGWIMKEIENNGNSKGK